MYILIRSYLDKFMTEAIICVRHYNRGFSLLTTVQMHFRDVVGHEERRVTGEAEGPPHG